MRFAPEYVECVLNENFEDAKAHLLSPLIAIHYAHLVMLAARGIVSTGDAHALRVALRGGMRPRRSTAKPAEPTGRRDQLGSSDRSSKNVSRNRLHKIGWTKAAPW